MTTTQTRVYIARLAGLAVFDPNGDQVGKVRDVVVQLLGEAKPPRVVGLVAEVQRRRIFIPITRVTSLDANAVFINGMVNMRRFEQRPNETLIIGELLDRTALRLDTREEVVLQDVAMQQDRTRDWSIMKVFVRKTVAGTWRRRHETATLDWHQVSGLSLHTEEQSAHMLLNTMHDMHEADIANLLLELPAKRRLEVARSLDDEVLAEVLGEMSEEDAIEIVSMLEGERAADVIEEMNPDDAADILGEMSPEQADDLLNRMEPEEAEDIRRLMSYGDYTAGGMMTTEPVVLSPDATVAEALARVRNEDLSPALASQVYVVRPPTETPTGKYLGVAHTQRLLREAPSSLVAGILDSDLEPVGPNAPLGQVTRYFATYNLVALPVVDEDDHLIGAVTVDDVIDHMLPENWRDEEVNEGDQHG